MKKIKHIVNIIIFLILLNIANGFLSSESKIVEWYGVADWELDACSKWGGTEESQQSTSKSSNVFLSQLTLTLQGKKTEYPDGSYLYEFTWYIQPVGGSVRYEVIAFNSASGSPYVIDDAIVEESAILGGGGYQSHITTENYDKIKMIYDQGTTNEIELPIVTVSAD
jgi:hypothetical protein